MKKVYIIDDDRNIVESMTIVLKSRGYEVDAQYDQSEVVRNVAEKKPDVVILDVMFPENESAGFDMARDLRADARTGDVRIIMLSAINAKGVYAGTFSNKDRDDSWLPVDDFVEKPIRPAQLLEKVEAVLAKPPRPRS